jgi:hypothetical protein
MFNFGGMFQPQAARPAPLDTSCQASRAGTVLALSSFHPRWPVLSRAPPIFLLSQRETTSPVWSAVSVARNNITPVSFDMCTMHRGPRR